MTNTFYISIVAIITFAISCDEQKPTMPVPDIPVYKVTTTDVPIYEEFVGETLGFKDIAIRARVEGYLEEIHFKEGSHVNKGDVLYTLESQQYEAAVAEKESMVAEQQTLLANAETELGRIRPLAEENAVSMSDLDSAVARYEAAQASVDAAKANLQAAEIELGYTKIYSPISGIIGKTQAKVGDFVGRNPNPVILNTVSSTDTILVQFYLNETTYLEAAKRILAAGQKLGDGKVELELILADGSVYEYKGTTDFIDRNVDTSTGAILIQSSFPNPQGLLRPGQFARVKAKIKEVKDGILIPQRCVSELQGQHSVFVVGVDNKIKTTAVTVGPKTGQFWLITDGLNAGDMVVYEGLQKVKDGAVINPVLQDIKLPTVS